MSDRDKKIFESLQKPKTTNKTKPEVNRTDPKTKTETKTEIERIFWSFRDVAMEGHLTDLDDSLRYNHVFGERGKFLGLVPIVRIRFEVSSNLGQKKEFFSIYGTLDDLGILIKRLQETYESAMNDVKRLKQEFKEKIICTPEDD